MVKTWNLAAECKRRILFVSLFAQRPRQPTRESLSLVDRGAAHNRDQFSS
jgi:hypothetical protein